MMLGTPDFIAPEQIVNATTADIRADIYSLGCTLYCLLAGRPPFQGVLYDVLKAHRSQEAEPLNLVRPEIPAELAALVARMIAKKPGQRFQQPAEVARALAPYFKARIVGGLGATGTIEPGVPPETEQATPSPTAADRGGPVRESVVELDVKLLDEPKLTAAALEVTGKRSSRLIGAIAAAVVLCTSLWPCFSYLVSVASRTFKGPETLWSTMYRPLPCLFLLAANPCLQRRRTLPQTRTELHPSFPKSRPPPPRLPRLRQGRRPRIFPNRQSLRSHPRRSPLLQRRSRQSTHRPSVAS